MNKFDRAREQDQLAEQCKYCRHGGKIGPRSGCDIRRLLIVQRDKNAWKNKSLYLNSDGTCKMFEIDR